MATCTMASSGISPGASPSAPLPTATTLHMRKNAMPALANDEDASSLSSMGTEISEVFSRGTSSQSLQWKGGDLNLWRRHGSTESATSFTTSSRTPSSIQSDKSQRQSRLMLTSRKRSYDGTPKVSHHTPTVKVDSKPSHPVNLSVRAAVPVKNISSRPASMQQPKQEAKVSKPISTKSRPSASTPARPSETRPRSSIPNRIPVALFASQCIKAAHSSRLDPYALHVGENGLLADLLMDQEVTIYLNIRNAILRLWCQNPSCAVTLDEALGCAKDGRFFGLAEVAYKWLVRNGYVNFGCVEPPRTATITKGARKGSRQRTIAVVGAGVAGLTAARQLESLIIQYEDRWQEMGEQRPRVIVLEGRKRIGGRVYSKPLRSQEKSALPSTLRNTAEMGAMIVTGFEHGNPLDAVIRGQLGLHYHRMTDRLTIYDCDGRPVNEKQDMLNTDLYTDISDRAGHFRAVAHKPPTLRGEEDLIRRFQDPMTEKSEDLYMGSVFDVLDSSKKPSYKRGRRRNAAPGTEKLTGRSQVVEETGSTKSAAQAAQEMGWQLKGGVDKEHSISLHRIANANIHPTLGAVMDQAIEQYQTLVNIKPRDMKLLNWHHANLEYANAAPVSSLSLSGHDQDTGNEFEGAHSEVVGGYTQLPRGLMNLPNKLDVRLDHTIDSIHYDIDGDLASKNRSSKIVTTDGEVIEADQIVLTVPLGVLKTNMIDFDPPLPTRKRGAIDRMGFGLLNKVIMLYDEPFWDTERDMFGLLNEPDEHGSLNPAHYAQNRGRFYLIWNASKTSGRPTLIALMAGKAAEDVETTDTNNLLQEITVRLRKVFTHTTIPAPREVIVTRWRRDPFTRGTYSFVAPETRPSDYDLMAETVGNMHFAGEATCGTHPATVHGAFLSGLRAAADVMDALIGPLKLPTPLVPPTSRDSHPSSPLKTSSTPSVAKSRKQQDPTASRTIKIEPSNEDQNGIMTAIPKARAPSYIMAVPAPPRFSVCADDLSFWVQPTSRASTFTTDEAAVSQHILSILGERPLKPSRSGVNPFLLYSREKWDECKASCSSDAAPARRDYIRQMLGKWWRQASDATKQPYVERGLAAQASADRARGEWDSRVKEWDEAAAKLRAEYISQHQQSESSREGQEAKQTDGERVGMSKRKTNVSNNVVLDHV